MVISPPPAPPLPHRSISVNGVGSAQLALPSAYPPISPSARIELELSAGAASVNQRKLDRRTSALTGVNRSQPEIERGIRDACLKAGGAEEECWNSRAEVCMEQVAAVTRLLVRECTWSDGMV